MATKFVDEVGTLTLGRNGGWTVVASLACMKFACIKGVIEVYLSIMGDECRSLFDRSALGRSVEATTSPSPNGTTNHTQVCVGTCTQTCKRFHTWDLQNREGSRHVEEELCRYAIVMSEEDMACTKYRRTKFGSSICPATIQMRGKARIELWKRSMVVLDLRY